jgi:hypothetical protein
MTVARLAYLKMRHYTQWHNVDVIFSPYNVATWHGILEFGSSRPYRRTECAEQSAGACRSTRQRPTG